MSLLVDTTLCSLLRIVQELSKKTEIEEKDIRKYYCELKRLLARKAKATSPKDLVPRICSNVNSRYICMVSCSFIRLMLMILPTAWPSKAD